MTLPMADLAMAQSAAPSDPATAAAPGPVKLEAVNVTAERREENIKDVPVSITTLGGEKLDVLNSSGQDVRFLSGRVPSLLVESSFGRAFPRFYIRGYGNSDFHLNASQPVSLIYDDVVQENPILKGFPVFDTQQIEVLRGPQGSLFGRNTPAGVVKFDSVRPFQGTEAYVNLSDATYNTSNLEGAVNIPLNHDWSARASVLYQHRDDWVHNTFDGPTKNFEGYDDQAGRLQLLYQPGGDFSALFNIHSRDVRGSARVFRANIIKPGSNNDFVDGFDPASVSTDGRNSQAITSTGGSARLTWKLDGMTLHSITGYETVKSFSRGDIDGGYGASFAPPYGPGFIPFPSETADALPNHKQVTQEFRLQSDNKGPFNWIGGFYYFHEDYTIDSYDYNTLGGGVQDALEVSRQKNDAYALFGSVSYDLTPQFKMRGGLRYTSDKKDFATESYTSTNGTSLSGPLTASPKATKTNFDLSGTYAITPDVNLYSRVATGFRGPSIQPASAFGPQSVAKPETSTSYEAGVKADLFDKRARLGFSLFHYDVKNQQLSAVGGTTNVTTLINAKKTMGQGFELDLDAYLTENLLATVGASYNFTKIKDPTLAVGTCAACTITNPAGPVAGTVLIDGNPLPQAPKVIANFTLRYGIPTTNGGEYFVYTDWSYRSKVNFFLYNSPEFTGKPLTEGGLRAGYNWGYGKYEVAAFARNITNQIRIVGGIDFDNLTGFINEPRIVGVQFKAKY